MASNFESSIQKGSDWFFDFSCYMCKENDSNTEADFYCTQCSKFYCGKCVEIHNHLFKKHLTLGKEKISSWPHDLEEQCQDHKGEKLTAFCEDHDHLLCHVCHIYKHKNCTHVVLITDKVKALREKGEFKQLSAILDTLHGQFVQKKNDFEESIQFVEKSHKQILEEINTSHKKITSQLDHLKEDTIKELDTLQATLKLSIQKDITHCNESVQTIKDVQEDWQKITGKSEILHFITYTKCLDHSIKAESILKEKSAKKDIKITFQRDTTIDQILSPMSRLGKIDVNQPAMRSITTDKKPTQAEPYTQKPSSSSSKQPDKANPTIDVNNPYQMVPPVSSSSKQPDKANPTIDVNNPYQMVPPESSSSKTVDKVNPTSVVNNPDQVVHPLSSSSKKSDAGNQSSDVKQSGPVPSSSKKSDAGNQSSDVKQSRPVSSAFSLPEHRYEKGAVKKPNLVSDPNKIIRMKSKTEYCVKDYREDINTCLISGICETAAGELLIVDRNNCKVKLLDETFKVVAICDFDYEPLSICSIDSSLVAVTVSCVNEVDFIRVTNGQLVNDRTLKLQHKCQGIAHHQGSLYITSGTALYHYTMDGTQVRMMYENIFDGWSVLSCAVSPDGDRIYVTDKFSNQLVTLSRDGKVISRLTDPALEWTFPSLPGLHVTDSGQVLVCVYKSQTVLQVDRDGRQILAEVVTEKDGVTKPIALCYSKQRGTLIVGMYKNNNIMVIITE